MHVSFDMKIEQTTLCCNISSVWLKGHCVIVPLHNFMHNVSCHLDFCHLSALVSPLACAKSKITVWRCRTTEQTDKQISATTRIRGIAFHQFTRYCMSAPCGPRTAPCFVSKTERRATKHQNRKMQKWGREKERRRKREEGGEGFHSCC